MLHAIPRTLVFWSILLVGLVGAAGVLAAEPIPKGEVTKYTFDKSKIFPGTVRDYWVYVPEAVRPGQAGLPARQPGRRPVQRPGRLRRADRTRRRCRSPSACSSCTGGSRRRPTQALDRFNRSYEYDGLGDNYARFLLDELLPEVEKKTTADGRPIRLSHDGNDRAHRRLEQRRDLRVHRGLGAARRLPPRLQRDRHLRRPARRQRLPDLDPQVRAEADPRLPPGRQQRPEHLRRRLVDGQPGDGAGPDLRRLRGQPRLGRRAATTASTPRRSSPTPCAGSGRTGPRRSRPAPARSSCRRSSIPGEGWKLVAEGYKFTEGPAANAKGEVFFNDIPNSKTYKIGLDGKVSLFLADSKKGQRPGVRPRRPALRRRHRRRAGPRLRRRRQADRDRRRLPRQRPGRPPRRRPLRHQPQPRRQPSRARSGTSAPRARRRSSTRGLKFSNGVTLSPDQSLLYVADSRTPLGLQLPDPARRLARPQAEVLPPARPRHRRRQRRRRHARRPRRPALRGHADGHPGLRPGRAGSTASSPRPTARSPTSASAARTSTPSSPPAAIASTSGRSRCAANAYQAPIKPPTPRL